MEAFKEKTVGFLLVIGSVISIVSLIAMFMFAGGGILHGTYTRDGLTNQIKDPGDLNLVPLAILGLVAGIALVLGSIGYGYWTHRTRHMGLRETRPHVKVLARYGFTKDWHMLTADWELDQADNPHYFVRLEFSPNEVREFECSPQIYFQCGEGMVGEAEIQGKWVGKFLPYIGVPGR